MKQIIQSLKNGKTNLIDTPTPSVEKGMIKIQSSRSLISLGTEKMLVEFGNSSLIAKARQQPDKVKLVLEKIKLEGLLPTLENVFNKLGQPIPLGYCNVGRVIDIGEGISEFSIGDRVASNGPHAEIVSVPQNLAVKIPESVSDDDATFTVIGSIGLQGVRLLKPQIGEVVVVIGLGLIGLITCQILKANGCKVIGIDFDQGKCNLAKSYGVKVINSKKNSSVKSVLDITHGIGADGVLITASSQSNDLISHSAQMSKKLGRVILIGVVGLNLNRADFYEKEIMFQVSCSYGPGRYDNQYELKGVDYPISYVRWTEKRNFETVLDLINSKIVNVKNLITEKINLSDYKKVYENIGERNSIASIIKYNVNDHDKKDKNLIKIRSIKFSKSNGVLGVIGSGNFTSITMLPILKKCDARIKMIASAKGLNPTLLANKYNIEFSTSDYKKVLADKDIDTVLITTRHDSHAKLVIESLQSGKNTFVEKPLALNNKELDNIIEKYRYMESTKFPPNLTVGFNRRFSPHVMRIKESIGVNSEPLNIIANMNAGFIPKNHWVNDLSIGGGRVIGEACHLIDTCVYLTGSKVQRVCANSLGSKTDLGTENISIILKFLNGSNAVINYFSNGSKKYAKERIEVYSQERTLIIDNYQKSECFGNPKLKTLTSKIDKGHFNQFNQLVKSIRKGGNPLIPFGELINVTQASFAVLESLKNNIWISI